MESAKSQYQRQEGMRGQGWVGDSSQGRGVSRRGFSPLMTYPPQTPSILPPLSRQRAMYRETPKNCGAGGREGGRWREIGKGGEERVAQPCPTSPRGQSHGKRPPTPLFHTGPPTLGERDMAFPRVSSPVPLGVETMKREGRGRGGCVSW